MAAWASKQSGLADGLWKDPLCLETTHTLPSGGGNEQVLSDTARRCKGCSALATHLPSLLTQRLLAG